MAYGIAAYLNSSAIDEYFRRFNGHTQVNATDLRSLKYPPTEILALLGKWAVSQPGLTQDSIDNKLESLLA
jgi:adenine-specific DNA-methyltransferase